MDDAELATLVADHTVKTDFSFHPQVSIQDVLRWQRLEMPLLLLMDLRWDQAGRTVFLIVHTIAPSECLHIQINQIGEGPSWEKIILHIVDQSFRFSFVM